LFIAKWAGIGMGGVLIILSGLISVYHLAYYQKIYPYVLIGKVEISNLTIEEAKAKLKQMVITGQPMLELEFNDQVWPVEIKDLSFDPQTTAETAYVLGRDEDYFDNLKTKWYLWRDRKEMLMRYQVDGEALSKDVELILVQVEEPVIEPTLKLNDDNQVSLMPGKNGKVVDKEKLWDLIDQRLGSLELKKVELPVKMMNVEVTGEELAKAQGRAENLKLKKLSLSYGEYAETLTSQELLDLIDFKDSFNEEKIASIAASLAKGINRSPQNAAFRFESGRVTEFKPALKGQNLNIEATVEEIKNKLIEVEGQECEERVKCPAVVAKLVVTTTEPEVSIAEVNNLGIKELLGKGESTFHGSIASREHNVALTAAKLNGILLAPGETFSFNQTIGDVSAETGFQQAYIIKEGRTVLGDGGGVCQDSTTMFRAALDAGLEIVQRNAHAYRVSYYEQNSPAGIDATVYSPSPDFKFKNDTPAHILIQTTVNTGANYLKIEVYGTSDGRVSTISNARLWDQVPPPPALYQDDPSLPNGQVKQIDWEAWGAKAAFDWKVVRGSETLHEKTFYSNYRPWQAVYLRGTGG